jgi:hypothetical protein
MRVSNLGNDEKALAKLMEAAEKGNYSVPVFQRDYVWSRKDVVSLADSVVRGYPIGSLLTMPTNGTLQIPGSKLRTPGSTLNGLGQDYIMDGQQRLTALFKIFVGGGEENYYFDQLAILNSQFPEDDILKYLVDDKDSQPDSIGRFFCVAYKSSANSLKNGRQIRCKSVMKNTYTQMVIDYLANLVEKGVPNELREKYQNFLIAIFSQVCSYQVPLVVIASDTSLEMICHIFDKVNRSGVRLDALDLLNAKTYSAKEGYRGGITTYITDSIKSWPIYQIDSFKAGINKFFKYDSESGSFKHLDSIIRAMYLGDFIGRGVQKPTLNPGKIMERDAKEWFSDWDRNEGFIRAVLTWANENAIFNITSPSLFEYLLGVCIGVPKAFELNPFRDALIRYIYSRAIGEIRFTLAETATALAYAEFGRSLVSSGVNYREKLIEPGKLDINIEAKHILKATSGKKSFQGILGIMYYQRFQSKFAKDIFGENFNSKMQLHHLVPKASWDQSKPLVYHDTIANIVYLNQDANQYKLRDGDIKSMKRRLLENCEGNQEAVDIALDSNLIPRDIDDHEEFMIARATLVLKYVRDFFGLPSPDQGR